MKRSFVLAIFSAAALAGLLVVTAQNVRAQDVAHADQNQVGVAITNLSAPVYPALARQARITGDVRIDLVIRRDGSVESAVLFSGHPMLKQAALESARKSQFECRGCDAATPYSLTYTFAIGNECRNTPDCSAVAERLPEIQQSMAHVMLTVDPLCTCDPSSTITRIKWRSARCLYLWHCASRVIDSR